MTPDKERFYENATRKLLATVDEMKMDTGARLRAKNLVLLFRDSFKLPDVKYKTFYPDLGDDFKCFRYDSEGFCRISSINFSVLMGDMKNWRLMYIDDLWPFGPHHYLMHMPSGKILDLTYDQYTVQHIDIPYEIGHKVSYHLKPDDGVLRFADAVGVDFIQELKKQKE